MKIKCPGCGGSGAPLKHQPIDPSNPHPSYHNSPCEQCHGYGEIEMVLKHWKVVEEEEHFFLARELNGTDLDKWKEGDKGPRPTEAHVKWDGCTEIFDYDCEGKTLPAQEGGGLHLCGWQHIEQHKAMLDELIAYGREKWGKEHREQWFPRETKP